MVSVKIAADWTGVAGALSAVNVGPGWAACVGARVGCTTGKLVGRTAGDACTVGSGSAADPLL